MDECGMNYSGTSLIQTSWDWRLFRQLKSSDNQNIVKYVDLHSGYAW